MIIHVIKTIINHPFGNGLYNLFMVIWGMVYLLKTALLTIGYKVVEPTKNHEDSGV